MSRETGEKCFQIRNSWSERNVAMPWYFWALIPVLLGLIGAFIYLRNQRSEED